MLIIDCPNCGLRAESEFAFGGEGGIARPPATEILTDEQWGDYLFMRRNPKGLSHEQWRHASGCGKWFNALRDTVSYRIHATWRIGDPSPEALGQVPFVISEAPPANGCGGTE